MQTLESLKRSIKNVQDLESVVRTMKTLAAVSIRQYEQAVESLTEYDRTIEVGMRMVLWNVPPEAGLRNSQSDGECGAIVIGSDQGMCGQFNEQITSYALEIVEQEDVAAARWRFLTIGARVSGRLLDAGTDLRYRRRHRLGRQIR